MNKTGIGYCNMTVNPIVGCTEESEGCKNCWARELHNKRFAAFWQGKNLPEQYSKPFSTIQFFRDRMDKVLRMKKHQVIFVCDMSDLFHKDVSYYTIADIWDTMIEAKQHNFLILTKRTERIREFLLRYHTDSNTVLPENNIWIGATIEKQKYISRLTDLLYIKSYLPYNIWLSMEPLLEMVNLGLNSETGSLIGGVVVGGESGSAARPMHPDWVKFLRLQCEAWGIPFYFKQWGEYVPDELGGNVLLSDGRLVDRYDYITGEYKDENPVSVIKPGKKKSGRLLDGREYNDLGWQLEKAASNKIASCKLNKQEKDYWEGH